MAKNILILSSEFTGHGHKSIADALKEQFAKQPDVKVHVVDGFTLGGAVMLRMGKLYGSITRNTRDLWKLAWELSLKRPSGINEFTEQAIKKNFIQLLKNIQPDLIVTVHSLYNGSVLNILKEYKINIPFVTLIADLVSITPLWADHRADYVLCPTQESKYKCLEFGVPEAKLKVVGFPVREKFCRHLETQPGEDNSYRFDRPLECLIMSGGEGSGNMSRIAAMLLKNFDCRVKLVAGRNKALRRRLENTLPVRYAGRVTIYGFVDNVQELMLDSDLVFLRGSPNTMMEAVMCNTPMIITGALPGQEEGNPGYAVKNKLGIVCEEPGLLKGMVKELLADDARLLNELKRSQRYFRNPAIAADIADFLLGLEVKGDTSILEIPLEETRVVRLQRLTTKIRMKTGKKS